MKKDIKNKLEEKLQKDFLEESDVVYILSRIRKILEIDEQKEKYKILNFYCNWALHAKINCTHPIKNVLMDLEKDMAAHVDFVTHKPFKNDILLFLKEYNLRSVIFDNSTNLNTFNRLLLGIYSDTPLSVKNDSENFTITLNEVGNDGVFNIVIDKSNSNIK